MPGSGSRTAVRHAESAADFIPPRASLSGLRAAAARCRGCDLWTCGRTVFGEGPRTAQVMLVGEQPSDQEEKAGHPFVGPSGERARAEKAFFADIRAVAKLIAQRAD